MLARTPTATTELPATLRRPARDDGAALHQLIAGCPPLDLNSPYAYLLLCEHHADTCVVAEQSGKIVGAVTGYMLPARPDILFVWQVAVAQPMQGQGLGQRMLDHLFQRCLSSQAMTGVETTISPSNLHSQKLFAGIARQHRVSCEATPFLTADDFGGSSHEEERLYQLGPWPAAI